LRFLPFLQVATLALSNVSLEYLNVPTQMMFKSCKLLPVIVVKQICFHRRSSLTQYISAILLMAGLVAFTVGDAKVSQHLPLIATADTATFPLPFFSAFAMGGTARLARLA
jgi:adenosine 3'-phospho 5'-phosphosulfate transporter B3